MKDNSTFTSLENEYLSFVKTGASTNPILLNAHNTAEIIYSKHRPIGTIEAGLYLMWFSVFIQIFQAGEKMDNSSALAAAMDYIWSKYRNEKTSQKEMASLYGLSTATLQKYIKIIKKYND
ncbi:helix-turn-helix domain-containing protein [Paenibacillus alvei]